MEPHVIDQSAFAVARILGRRFAFGTPSGWLVIAVPGVVAPAAVAVGGILTDPWLLAAVAVGSGLAAIGAIFTVSLIVAPVHQRNEARRMLKGYRVDAASRAIAELTEFRFHVPGVDLDALTCLTARDMVFGYGMSEYAFSKLLAQKGVYEELGSTSMAASVLGFMATVGVIRRAETRWDAPALFVLTDLGVEVLRRTREERRGILIGDIPGQVSGPD